jgi:hypothetical protein
MADIFLCHTGADKEWVENLATRLEAAFVDGRPISVFLDKWDIAYGENLLHRIEQGLKEARFLGTVLSPAFTRAEWPTMEWQSQVYEDPSGRLGRIIPILLHKYDPETNEPIEIPLPLRILRYFDFSEESRFESEFERLVRRIAGKRPERGEHRRSPPPQDLQVIGNQAAPDDVSETLFSNLLPVKSFPSIVHTGITTAETKQAIWRQHKGPDLPPFAIQAGRLYTFSDLRRPANLFRPFLKGETFNAEQTSSFLSDSDRSRLLIGLLNAGLKAHCRSLDIWTTKELRPRFYCPIIRGSRAFRWSEGAKQRTLAKLVKRKDGSAFGVHYSARIRFFQLRQALFLLIEPGWLFTEDGIKPLIGKEVTRLSTAWGGRERNQPVSRNVLMWAILLARGAGEITLSMSEQETRLSTTGATCGVPVGVYGDAFDIGKLLGQTSGGEFVPLKPASSTPDDDLDVLAALELSGALDPLDSRRTEEDDFEDPNLSLDF